LIILPGEGFVKEAISLGEKGKRNLPEAWEPPYYTGLVYHIKLKDYLSAAKEFELAAEKLEAPPITKYFAGLYYSLANERKLAYAIFQTVYQTSENEFIKERAKKNIDHLDILNELEKAVEIYTSRYGRVNSLDDLVRAKLIKEIPEDPLGIGFMIKDGQVASRKKL